MSTIALLIRQLKQQGIQVRLNGDDLLLSSPEGQLEAGLLASVSAHKQGLIDFLRKNGRPTTFSAIAPAVSGDSGEGYVLSSAQRRLWVLSRLDGGSTAYHMPGRFLFRGVVDEQAMDRAFLLLVDRHAILRTVFREDERGVPRQVVLAAAEAGLRLSRSAAGVGEPFDLRRGPLLRAGLYRTGEQEWVFYYEMHHIISDGWSLGVLTRELLQLYDSQVRAPGAGAVEAGLAPLRIQYKDYACWQQQRLQSGALSADRDYWLERLGGELPVMELAGDRPRPSVRTYKGGTVRRVVSGAVRDGLEELCRQEGCTLFMGLLAAVNVLLYRYTDQNDILVGSPVAGREHADLEGQIGFYVNTLVLRNRVEGEQSFRALLREFRRTTLEAYAHQHYPFDELVDALPLRRDMSRNPLFDVMVVLRNNEINESPGTYASKTFEMHLMGEPGDESSKFDLSFTFARTDEGIKAEIEYNAGLYVRPTVERMSLHLELILTAMAADPVRACGDVDLLDAESRQVLFSADGVQEAIARVSLPELFERQAVLMPDRPALDADDGSFSYAELDAAASRLGNYLRIEKRIGRGEPIGIRLPRGRDLVVAMLGVWKAGAAYVPIDADHPEQRVQYLLNDSCCRVVIDGSLPAESAGYSRVASPLNIRPDDLAYILYTSGSTGEPKGVMITHGSLGNFSAVILRNFPFGGAFRCPVLASNAFDIFLFECFLPLLQGGTALLPGNRRIRDMGSLAELLGTVTAFHAVPSLMAQVVGYIDREASRDRFQGISDLFIGGDAVPTPILQQMRAVWPLARIHVLYGPTEACIFTAVRTYHPGGQHLLEGAVIGRPVASTEIHIRSCAGNLQPIGVPGEICISGPGLASAYWRRPELTAEKFIAMKAVSGGRTRNYLTGDLGRWLPDGNLEFLGRIDSQVKIRGHRVEPGEVEAVLARYPGVTGAVVLACAREDGEKELVGYITGGARFTSSELLQHMSSLLPSYMVPGCYIQLDGWPVNANGKVDRRRLQPAAGALLGTASGYEAPEGETEQLLVRIWQEVLDREKIGVLENFFELGGNSIRIIKMAGMVSQWLGRPVSVTLLFQYPTIRSLAAHLVNDGLVAPEYDDFARSELLNDLDKFN